MTVTLFANNFLWSCRRHFAGPGNWIVHPLTHWVLWIS